MTTATLWDDRACKLGEGPLWHPERKQLFWFDILGQKLLTRTDSGPIEWHFDEIVSAAGWVDDSTLLIASETALFTFDLNSAESEFIAPLEADTPATRSNDGRADPWGGFWIGTMSKTAETGAGRDLSLLPRRVEKTASRHHHPKRHLFFARRSLCLFRRYAHQEDHAPAAVWFRRLAHRKRRSLVGSDGRRATPGRRGHRCRRKPMERSMGRQPCRPVRSGRNVSARCFGARCPQLLSGIRWT